MGDTLQFVDSIAASPTVRLNLNDEAPWALKYEGSDLSPPDLRRGMAQTLLAHGGMVTAAAYDLRLLRLRLEMADTTPDVVASRIQTLQRELNRPTNLIRWQPGTTAPVFFRTMRSPVNKVTPVPGGGNLQLVDVDVLAEPFAFGLRENLPSVTVYADPAEGLTLNANPFFETDASNWTQSGGTIARSTAQFHEGAASLLLTPDGVTGAAQARAELVPVTTGLSYRVSAWVRCAVARSVRLTVDWHDGGGGLLSSSNTDLAVAATTWTLIDATLTAPASAAQARIVVQMTSTPPGSNTLHIDEARIRLVGSQGAMYFDLSNIKGDVETPLYLSVSSSSAANFVTSAPDSSRVSAIAVRRRGTPSGAPFVLQAESMTMGTDTSTQANSAVMSGSGNNWTRTTFATVATMQDRLSIASWPAAGSVDVRGRYRVFMRYRQSAAAGAPMQARLLWGTSNTYNTNDAATLVQVDGGGGGPYMKYADLGVVQFPQGYDPVSDGPDGVELPVEGMAFVVQAVRTSGSASLDIDCLLFVPADDRLALVTWPASPTLPVTLSLDSDKGQVYAEGTVGVLGRSGAKLDGAPPLVSPGVTNRITFVRDVGTNSSIGGSTTGDDITASMVLNPYYWPLYQYARPASS